MIIIETGDDLKEILDQRQADYKGWGINGGSNGSN